MAELDPRSMILSLRKEMNLIKAEEMSLKQQILSLNDQYQVLLTSVSNLYLNNDTEANLHEEDFGWLSSNDIRKERKSRWNEWRQDKPRRSFEATTIHKSPESTSFHDNEQPLRNTVKSPPSSRGSYATERTMEQEGDGNNVRTQSGQYDRLFALDNDRRKRISKRLKESRKTLDVVPLGLF